MRTTGIDIGKRKCVVSVKDSGGRVLLEAEYPNTRKDAREFARRMARGGPCQAVCESTANLWMKTYGELEAAGMPVKLANPVKTKHISEASLKNDGVDAGALADLGRANLVAECHVASKGARQSRALLRRRIRLVQDRTKAVSRGRNVLDRYDLAPPQQSIFGVNGMRWLERQELDGGADRDVIAQCVRHVRYLDGEISAVEEKIAADARKSRYARLIMGMNGFDYFGAMLLAAEIDDISRFRTAKKLVSWSG